MTGKTSAIGSIGNYQIQSSCFNCVVPKELQKQTDVVCSCNLNSLVHLTFSLLQWFVAILHTYFLLSPSIIPYIIPQIKSTKISS